MERIRRLQAQSFSKAERLQKRGSFVQLSRTGKKAHSRYFLVLFSGNGLSRTRIGITASRKVGNAVQRNRIKRLVREYFRTRGRQAVPECLDLNVIAKREAAGKASDGIFTSLEELLSKVAEKVSGAHLGKSGMEDRRPK